MPECETQDPVTQVIGDGHRIDCHLFDETVMEDKDASQRQIVERQERTTGVPSTDDD